jgi:hypothetical protein
MASLQILPAAVLVVLVVPELAALPAIMALPGTVGKQVREGVVPEVVLVVPAEVYTNQVLDRQPVEMAVLVVMVVLVEATLKYMQ